MPSTKKTKKTKTKTKRKTKKNMTGGEPIKLALEKAVETAINTAVETEATDVKEVQVREAETAKKVEEEKEKEEEEERVKREAKAKAEEDKKAYVQEQIDIVQKKQIITVIETALETAVEKEVYNFIKIEFNSKKKTNFDPKKLIPNDLKPNIKYDEERTKKAKQEKEKAKAKAKKRGWRQRAGMEENLGIFKVSKDVNLNLKDLRNAIKVHTATLNENPDEPIVIPNSIKIFEYDSNNEEEPWKVVEEEAKQAQGEVGKKDSKIVVQIEYVIDNISKLKTLIPKKVKEKKEIEMLPINDVDVKDEPMKSVGRVTNTASVVGKVAANMFVSSWTDADVPLNLLSKEGKKRIIVTFISELTREKTIKVLKQQVRWKRGIKFVQHIKEKNNTITVEEAEKKLKKYKEAEQAQQAQVEVKEEEGKEEEKKLTQIQKGLQKIVQQDKKLIVDEEEHIKKEEERVKEEG